VGRLQRVLQFAANIRYGATGCQLTGSFIPEGQQTGETFAGILEHELPTLLNVPLTWIRMYLQHDEVTTTYHLTRDAVHESALSWSLNWLPVVQKWPPQSPNLYALDFNK
jgi:hypothetical protein